MRNIKIIIEYDGTNYCGWQYQKNTDQTIQQKLEDALTKLNKAPVKVIGSGRTDSGAHALGQVANFQLDVPIPVERIPRALNSVLPDDIICKKAEAVADDFHARYQTRGKKYRYRFINRSYTSVFIRDFVYNIRQPLNINKMKAVIKDFQGTHDFAAFQDSGSDKKDTVRTIASITMKEKSPEHWIEVKGNGFLYKMVRIMVGTLLEIGMEKRKPDLKPIFKSKNRQQAGFTAPAKGLTLVEVYY